MEQSPLCRSNDRKAGLFRHGQPTAHLVVRTKKFVAFLWQIAPIVPVLPTAPIYKPFAVNKMLAKRYLDTVEVRSSSLLVPTILSITYEIGQELWGPLGSNKHFLSLAYSPTCG